MLFKTLLAEIIIDPVYRVFTIKVAFSRAITPLNLTLLYLNTINVPPISTFITEGGPEISRLNGSNVAAELTFRFEILIALVLAMMILTSFAELFLHFHHIKRCFF